MVERRPLKSEPTADLATPSSLATVASDNGAEGEAAVTSVNGGDELTIDSPLPLRLAELERRISAALTSERTAHDLTNLLLQTDLAIPAAEEFAKAELERALDPLQSPDPRAARQQAEDATFASNRLRTLRPRLLARYHDISAAEMRQQYLVRYEELKQEGAALGAELADLYPGLVAPLVEVFTRLRAFQQQCRALHVTDNGTGLPHVIDPELQARGLHGFTRDTPSLLESVHLRDWRSGREVWPPPSTFAADYVQSMGVPGHPGSAWADPAVQARIAAERAAENERMARHYAQAAKTREQTENQQLRENWELSQRRG
jgi:hypothetical protein